MERLTKRGTRKNGYVSAIGSGFGCWGEIIDRLAAYEDTGLMPEQVAAMALPVRHGRWINAWISGVLHYRCSSCGEYTEATWHANFDYNYCPSCGAKINDTAVIDCEPNTPLTLEELREMDGEPVWLVIADAGHYAVMRSCGERFTEFTDGSQPPNDIYGSYWMAYRRKPEEV